MRCQVCPSALHDGRESSHQPPVPVEDSREDCVGWFCGEKIHRISISNHMAVRVIWDISPELFFINFEITLADARDDFKIYKK